MPDATPLVIKPHATVSPSLHPVIYQAHNPSVKANGTSLGQTVVQKATKVGVASGIVKADDPTKPPSENVGKGYPETITSREIESAQQAVGNIKPGMPVVIVSPYTPCSTSNGF
jgi:hypothetical protein